jgi:hypothetical protein
MPAAPSVRPETTVDDTPATPAQPEPASQHGAPPGPPPPPTPATPAAGPIDLQAIWPRVLDAATSKPNLEAALETLEPAPTDDAAAAPARGGASVVTLRLTDPTLRFSIEGKKNAIEQLIAGVAGRRVSITLTDTPAGGNADDDGPPAALPPDAIAEAQRDPLVRQAQELFDARIVNVRKDG